MVSIGTPGQGWVIPKILLLHCFKGWTTRRKIETEPNDLPTYTFSYGLLLLLLLLLSRFSRVLCATP